MKRFINEVFGSTKDRNSRQWCLGLKLEVTKFGIKNSILKSLLKKTLATFVPGPLPIRQDRDSPIPTTNCAPDKEVLLSKCSMSLSC